MSKKNKPTIIRLGIHAIKNYINQNYGKTYNIYIYNFYYQQYFFNYITNYFIKYWNYINYIEIIWFKNKIILNLHYINVINYIKFIKKINFIFKNKIKLRLYRKNFSNTTTLLLNLYSNYLLKKNISPKKKLLILVHILNKTIKTYKLVYTKQGPVKLIMLGYKIKLSGRFESTKNQMSKNITYKFGKVSLVTLNNQLDFMSKTIFTKLGTYSLSIWLYYKSV